MLLYIAAPWVKKPEAIEIAGRFKEAGFEVNSRWFNHQGDPSDSTGLSVDKGSIYQQAQEDIEDIVDADMVVVLNLARSEGKAVETGFALATGTPVITVGPRGNIFAVLSDGEFDTVEDAISFLKAWEVKLGER